MITYMRTDGLQISSEAVQDIRSTVQDLHGQEYLPAKPRMYKCAALPVCRQAACLHAEAILSVSDYRPAYLNRSELKNASFILPLCH